MKQVLSSAISSCLDREAFAVGGGGEVAIARQLRAFGRLMERRETSDGLMRYLYTYDACMRLAEAMAHSCGVSFGAHPHVAFRAVAGAVAPTSDGELYRLICSARHSAKKEGVAPPPRLAASLESLLLDLQRPLSDFGITL